MIAFLDIETGGFSITKNGVCEIALIVVDEQLNPIDTFHTLIKPYQREDSDELVSYKDDAMAVNGLSVERLVNEGKDVKQVVFDIVDFFCKNKVKTIVGHNSNAFDLPRVNYLLKRFSNASLVIANTQDTMVIAKQKLNLSSYSLENLCAHFSIINEKQHSAKSDVLATIKLYKKLI